MKTAHPAKLIARGADGADGTGTRPFARGNRLSFLALLALVLAGPGVSRAVASDPIGIYALVDRVVFEPNETSPERIQVWGAFAIAEGSGSVYKNAERGYLYYKLSPDRTSVCRNEWADLKSVAGTGQIVAFASRYGDKGALRHKGAKPEKPDVYPVAMGVTRAKGDKDYEPLKQLAKLHEAQKNGKGGQ